MPTVSFDAASRHCPNRAVAAAAADASAYAELYMAWRTDHRNPALRTFLAYAAEHFGNILIQHRAGAAPGTPG